MYKKLSVIAIICTLIISLTGCSSDDYITEDNNQNWNEDVSYNEVDNSAKIMKSMEVSEDQILLFPSDSNAMSLITYLDEDKIKIMDANPSSSCSLQDSSKCSSALLAANNFTYYKGKLYYLTDEYSNETGRLNQVLCVSDLDGMNRKELINLDTALCDYPDKSNLSTNIEIHRDVLYISKGGNLFYTTLKDINPQPLHIDGVNGYEYFYLIDDTIYLYTPSYKIDDKFHLGVILETKLNSNEINIIKEDVDYTLGIDKKNLIYSEDEIIYMYDLESKQSKQMIPDDGYSLLISDNYYVLDSTLSLSNDAGIVLFNKNGEQLTFKNTKDEFHYPQLVKDNKYYVSVASKFWYYELSDTEISDRKMITMNDD